MTDTENDGSVGLDDLEEGDRARLIGKTTILAKRYQSGFTSTTTLRRIVFHAPPVMS